MKVFLNFILLKIFLAWKTFIENSCNSVCIIRFILPQGKLHLSSIALKVCFGCFIVHKFYMQTSFMLKIHGTLLCIVVQRYEYFSWNLHTWVALWLQYKSLLMLASLVQLLANENSVLRIAYIITFIVESCKYLIWLCSTCTSFGIMFWLWMKNECVNKF